MTQVTQYNEETANFCKSEFITSNDYVKTRKNFITSSVAERTQSFLNFCFAIINQKNQGALSIREASYVIVDCTNQGLKLNSTVESIITEAKPLRRHPANYKEDHQNGWDELVKQISKLRKTN